MSGATIPGAIGNGEEGYVWNSDTNSWDPIAVANLSSQTSNTAYYGSSGNNNVTLGSNNDFANGRGGGDTLSGADGNDFLVGGSGGDRLDGGENADTLIGGNATVTGSLTNGTFTVTTADDGFSTDTLIGGFGDDTFIVTSTSDSISGGDGTDTILLSGPTTYILGAGTGVENIALLNPASTTGHSISAAAAGNDAHGITGGAGADTINGGGGDDTLTGAGGNDILIGGTGNDVLAGGDGALDTASFAANTAAQGINVTNTGGSDGLGGTDSFTGIERILGGAGNDTIDLSGSDVTAEGGLGDDLIIVGNEGGGGTGVVASGGDGNNTLAFNFTTSGNVTVTDIGGGQFSLSGPGGFSGTASGFQNIRLADGTTTVFGADTFFVCFAGGTRILTAKGEVEVEALQAGDLVATLAGNGSPMKPVLWVGRRRVVLAGHPNAEDLAPVRIRAGALGESTPHRDLLVSPDHCMFLQGKLVPARLLVNGTSITVERGVAEVTWYHVELESHDVILAEGAAAESWLDADNRSWFENAAVAQMAIQGNLASAGTGWDASRACAPLVHGGADLAAIRAEIAARAADVAAQPEPARRSAAA